MIFSDIVDVATLRTSGDVVWSQGRFGTPSLLRGKQSSSLLISHDSLGDTNGSGGLTGTQAGSRRSVRYEDCQANADGAVEDSVALRTRQDKVASWRAHRKTLAAMCKRSVMATGGRAAGEFRGALRTASGASTRVYFGGLAAPAVGCLSRGSVAVCPDSRGQVGDELLRLLETLCPEAPPKHVVCLVDSMTEGVTRQAIVEYGSVDAAWHALRKCRELCLARRPGQDHRLPITWETCGFAYASQLALADLAPAVPVGRPWSSLPLSKESRSSAAHGGHDVGHGEKANWAVVGTAAAAAAKRRPAVVLSCANVSSAGKHMQCKV